MKWRIVYIFTSIIHFLAIFGKIGSQREVFICIFCTNIAGAKFLILLNILNISIFPDLNNESKSTFVGPMKICIIKIYEKKNWFSVVKL